MTRIPNRLPASRSAHSSAGEVFRGSSRVPSRIPDSFQAGRVIHSPTAGTFRASTAPGSPPGRGEVLREVLRHPLKTAFKIFKVAPEVGSRADWVPNKPIERENPWAALFRLSAKYPKTGKAIALVGTALILMAAYQFTPVGVVLNSVLSFVPMKNSWLIFGLSLVSIEALMGGFMVKKKDLATTGGSGWTYSNWVTRQSDSARRLAGAMVGLVSYALFETIFGFSKEVGQPLHQGVESLKSGIGGFLVTVALFYLIPTIFGLFKSHKSNDYLCPPSIWGGDEKMARMAPLAFGTTYMIAWQHLFVNSFLTPNTWTGTHLHDLDANSWWFPAAYMLFMAPGFAVMRALFFDRSKEAWDREYNLPHPDVVEWMKSNPARRFGDKGCPNPIPYVKKNGLHAWDAAMWVGAKIPGAKTAAVFLGIFAIADKLFASGSLALGKYLSFVDKMPGDWGPTLLAFLGTLCLATFLARSKKPEERL